MKRNQISARNWKAIVLGYDEIIAAPVSTDSQCYCLQDNEVEALIALVEPTAWRTRWYSESEAEIDPEETEDFMSILTRKLMSGCCGDGTSVTTIILHRVNETTGRLEISIDDGTTWTPDPADPANLVTVLPPPVTEGGSTTKCDAAINGRGHFEDLVAAHDSAFDLATTVIGFVTAVAIFIATEILTLGTATAFIPILLPIMTAIFSLGKTAFDAYFSTDVYDTLQCILFCHMDSSGRFSGAGYAAVLADIGTKLPAGVPRDMIYRDVQSFGIDGLNNFVAYGTSVGGTCDCDCGDCPDVTVTVGVLLERGVLDDGTCYVKVKSVDRTSHFGIEIAFNAFGTHPDALACAKYIGYTHVSGSLTTVNLYYQKCSTDASYYALATGDCMSYFDWEDYSGGHGGESVEIILFEPC